MEAAPSPPPSGPQPMSLRPARTSRADYVHFRVVPTRWLDNDAYGHVNNAVYYSFFDTAVNAFLIEGGALDLGASPIISLVVETGCTYFESLAFPEPVEVGLAVARIGTSSVRYEVGVFGPGRREAAAQGHFVHVTVDRATGRPVPVPEVLRALLKGLLVERGP